MEGGYTSCPSSYHSFVYHVKLKILLRTLLSTELHIAASFCSISSHLKYYHFRKSSFPKHFVKKSWVSKCIHTFCHSRPHNAVAFYLQHLSRYKMVLFMYLFSCLSYISLHCGVLCEQRPWTSLSSLLCPPNDQDCARHMVGALCILAE